MRVAGAAMRMPINRVGVRRSGMIMPKNMTVRASSMGMGINRMRMRRTRMMVLHGVVMGCAFPGFRFAVAIIITGIACVAAGIALMPGNRTASRGFGRNNALFSRSRRSAASRAGSFTSSTGRRSGNGRAASGSACLISSKCAQPP